VHHCQMAEDTAAAAIIAPFTVLRWQRQNDHISTPMWPETAALGQKRWREG
jgi:hypothetical protein